MALVAEGGKLANDEVNVLLSKGRHLNASFQSCLYLLLPCALILSGEYFSQHDNYYHPLFNYYIPLTNHLLVINTKFSKISSKKWSFEVSIPMRLYRSKLCSMYYLHTTTILFNVPIQMYRSHYYIFIPHTR